MLVVMFDGKGKGGKCKQASSKPSERARGSVVNFIGS